jgi:hypothetical protein
LSPFPARKLAVVLEPMRIGSPVRGFRPDLALRRRISKVPNPVIWR